MLYILKYETAQPQRLSRLVAYVQDVRELDLEILEVSEDDAKLELSSIPDEVVHVVTDSNREIICYIVATDSARKTESAFVDFLCESSE